MSVRTRKLSQSKISGLNSDGSVDLTYSEKVLGKVADSDKCKNSLSIFQENEDKKIKWDEKNLTYEFIVGQSFVKNGEPLDCPILDCSFISLDKNGQIKEKQAGSIILSQKSKT